MTEDELAENRRHEAIGDFKSFLAQRIDFVTRTELLLGAVYIWEESGPAVRFVVDDHVLVLAHVDGDCRLREEAEDTQWELARLSANDSQFEDRLLVSVGSVLDPVTH